MGRHLWLASRSATRLLSPPTLNVPTPITLHAHTLLTRHARSPISVQAHPPHRGAVHQHIPPLRPRCSPHSAHNTPITPRSAPACPPHSTLNLRVPPHSTRHPLPLYCTCVPPSLHVCLLPSLCAPIISTTHLPVLTVPLCVRARVRALRCEQYGASPIHRLTFAPLKHMDLKRP